jgi:hypothetical protein
MANPLPIQESRYRPIALALAVPATGTAACLSVLAGWQRGGTLIERLLWVAIGVVLVVSAHLLPALARAVNWPLRCIGALLWGACMAASCYGHITFFVLAQMHAGENRAAHVAVAQPVSPASTSTSARPLTQIARDRAAVVAELVRAKTPARRTALTARVDALDTETSEARRQEAAEDRATAQQDRVTVERDAARADPVTGRLAALVGVPSARVDLLSGLIFAAVLEGVACYCWVLALQPVWPSTVVRGALPDAATGDSHATVAEPLPASLTGAASAADTLEADSETTQLLAEITAGRVRATVADIRRHLGCSQSRALALRRQISTIST